MPPLRPAVTVHCPAKLNLTLDVGPPDATHPTRPGYHPVVSFMTALPLCDTLTAELADANAYDLRFADDAPLHQPVDWPIERDLCVKAHRAVEQRVGRTLPTRITLRKRIPAGSGLGGGSADAAGTLHAINTLHRLGLATEALLALAGTLGSDVAFALLAILGRPHALATGFGETIETVTPRWNGRDAVLILPAFGCATAEVYRAFDAVPAPRVAPAHTRALIDAAALEDALLFNDLTDAATRVQPALRSVFNAVRSLGMTPHLTGSGSAAFALTNVPDASRRVSDACGTVCLPIRIGNA